MESTHTPSGTREDRSVSMGKANLYALALILPVGAIQMAAHGGLHGWGNFTAGFDWWVESGRWVLGLVLGIVVHEGLHGLAWKQAAGLPWLAISFGFNWRALAPYAHCDVPMSARAYRIGAATPGLVLGILPALVGLALGWGAWAVFGVFYTVAAGGDALILWLLRNVPGGWLVEDHPSQAGCYVYVPDGAVQPTLDA
ncbi:MAG: DUF3267 domain-containing protein [Bacteroidota bacterium]